MQRRRPGGPPSGGFRSRSDVVELVQSGGEHPGLVQMFGQSLDRRSEVERGLAEPTGQRRAVKTEPRAGADLHLAMQRTMVSVTRRRAIIAAAAVHSGPCRRMGTARSLSSGWRREDRARGASMVCVPGCTSPDVARTQAPDGSRRGRRRVRPCGVSRSCRYSPVVCG